VPADLAKLGTALTELADAVENGEHDPKQLAAVLREVGNRMAAQAERLEDLQYRIECIESGRPCGRRRRIYTT